jgi:phosphohistidine swiveling domain-containing protein
VLGDFSLNQVRIVPLDTTLNIDTTAIGPKALSLIRLGQIGLRVPAGFCITAAVFREHLEQNDLLARLKAAADELAKAESQEKEKLLSTLRQDIIEAPIAESIRQEIEQHYRKLGAEYVAVRSSGTAEDLPGHSFAGQYDTYLGMSNLEDCIEAVKKCWASLWTLRAYEYRERNSFDHLKIEMAVIVQSLIAADTSGVIFTVDPVTGSRSSMVIEACFGLGDALVSGKVTPDRFLVGKKKLKLFSQTISEKKIEHTIGRNGLIEEKNIPSERSSICCLDKKRVGKLAKLARRIETEFGSPQDIEWAIFKKKIFLLQSRPITALPPEKSWEDRQIWCCNPAKEVIPDVATPMTLSVIDSMFDVFIGPVFRLLCMDRGKHPIYGLVAGRIYFNGNIWGIIFRELPGTKDLDFMKAAGSHKGLQKAVEGIRNATEEDVPDLKFRRYRFYLRIPLVIIGMLRNTPDKGRRILSVIEAKNEKWSRINAANMTVEKIGVCFREIMYDFNELMSHVLYLFSMIAALPMLDIICKRWLWRGRPGLGSGRHLAGRRKQGQDALATGNIKTGELLAGVGGMVDATAGLDIWRLAVAADSQKEVNELILSNNEWHTIEGKLSRTDSGREFLAEWNQFMLRHGHHCRGELELYNKRWSETPDYILKFIRNHITQMNKIDPVQNFDRATIERRKLEKQCRKQLKNPIKRLIFNHFLIRAQNGSVFRENVKSEVIKLLTAMRKLLIELGKRLKEKDILKDEDDIFFLRYEEIMPVVQGNADFNIPEVITARRAEYDKNCSVTPPDTVFGKFDPDNYIPDTIDEQAQELKGLGVSPGIATGKARVILRADTDEQLLAGEILIAPFTDPGWTPYFVPASAIVMDEGGIISHGSIVAREFGIPAVVNVGSATKIIKTGQKIQVDGDHGMVRIIQ